MHFRTNKIFGNSLVGAVAARGEGEKNLIKTTSSSHLFPLFFHVNGKSLAFQEEERKGYNNKLGKAARALNCRAISC